MDAAGYWKSLKGLLICVGGGVVWICWRWGGEGGCVVGGCVWLDIGGWGKGESKEWQIKYDRWLLSVCP